MFWAEPGILNVLKLGSTWSVGRRYHTETETGTCPFRHKTCLAQTPPGKSYPVKNLPYWPYQGLETKQTSLSLLSSEGFKASWDRLALACVTECEGADTVSPWPSRWFAAFLIGVTKHTTKGNVRSDGFVLAHTGVSGVTDSCEQPNLGVENRTQGLNH